MVCATLGQAIGACGDCDVNILEGHISFSALLSEVRCSNPYLLRTIS